MTKLELNDKLAELYGIENRNIDDSARLFNIMLVKDIFTWNLIKYLKS